MPEMPSNRESSGEIRGEVAVTDALRTAAALSARDALRVFLTTCCQAKLEWREFIKIAGGEYIKAVMEENRNNKTRTAKALRIHRNSLMRLGANFGAFVPRTRKTTRSLRLTARTKARNAVNHA